MKSRVPITSLLTILSAFVVLAGCITPIQLPTDQRAPVPAIQPALAPPTPDRYAGLTIDDLTTRIYGEGELRREETLAVSVAFTRTFISYDSDGLNIYGFMNVPQGEGPFPVVIVNHGYVDPAVYRTLTYTTRYADALANAGFIAIHPNLRGYPPSTDGPNEFRVGFAVDVLNLIALIRQQGGQPGPLAKANPDAIGLWGHSMGGGVTLRTLTISPHVRAALLYGSMSGDEQRNHERILFFTNGQNGLWDDDAIPPVADLQLISPIHYLDRIRAAVSLHHGQFDEQVPLEWSLELCDQLQALGKTVECFVYDNMPHTFQGEGDVLFIQRMVAFFNQYLK